LPKRHGRPSIPHVQFRDLEIWSEKLARKLAAPLAATTSRHGNSSGAIVVLSVLGTPCTKRREITVHFKDGTAPPETKHEEKSLKRRHVKQAGIFHPQIGERILRATRKGVVCRVLHVACGLLRVVCCMLCIARCVLHVVCCVACVVWHVVCCMLCVAKCMLRVKCSVQSVVWHMVCVMVCRVCSFGILMRASRRLCRAQGEAVVAQLSAAKG
jgi:hypothetical protein